MEITNYDVSIYLREITNNSNNNAAKVISNGIVNQFLTMDLLKKFIGTRKNKKLADCIKDLLCKYKLFEGTRIYFNNKCIDSKKGLLTNINPQDYIERADKNTISMSFEGELYDILNYNERNEKFLIEFDELLKTNGYLYILGESWNLNLYKL